MQIGLYFGSFNPIHIGHLAIANYMLEFTDLDQIWFVVSPQNPLKNKSSLLGDNHRLSLVREAIAENIKFKAIDIEFKLPKPSYTITTLLYLEEKYPDNKFVLIMGSDNLDSLHKWKNYEVILNNYFIYVYPRPKSDGGNFKNHPHVKLVNAPLMEVSATFLRNAIKEKKNVSSFFHPKVWDYIKEMHFYEK